MKRYDFRELFSNIYIMKKSLIITLLGVLLLLASCHVSNSSFNKQKFTHLKKIRTEEESAVQEDNYTEGQITGEQESQENSTMYSYSSEINEYESNDDYHLGAELNEEGMSDGLVQDESGYEEGYRQMETPTIVGDEKRGKKVNPEEEAEGNSELLKFLKILFFVMVGCAALGLISLAFIGELATVISIPAYLLIFPAVLELIAFASAIFSIVSLKKVKSEDRRGRHIVHTIFSWVIFGGFLIGLTIALIVSLIILLAFLYG